MHENYTGSVRFSAPFLQWNEHSSWIHTKTYWMTLVTREQKHVLFYSRNIEFHISKPSNIRKRRKFLQSALVQLLYKKLIQNILPLKFLLNIFLWIYKTLFLSCPPLLFSFRIIHKIYYNELCYSNFILLLSFFIWKFRINVWNLKKK